MSNYEVTGPYPGATYDKNYDNIVEKTASVAGVASGGTGVASASFTLDLDGSENVIVMPDAASTAIPDGWYANVDTTNDNVDVTVKNDTASSQDYDFVVVVLQ